MKRRVLIVEDDEIFLRPLRRTLEVAGFEVLALPSGEEAMDALKSEDVDVVLTDKRLPGMDGVELVRRIKADHPDLAVVMMTAYGTIESAVEAMRLGAADYLVKPYDSAELLIVLRDAIELHELRAANRATLRRNQERFTFRNVVAQSAAMREVFEVLRSVADLDTTVLIHGETGVGKELLARSVHFSGARRDKPFVAVNCAAIPGELFESELFGFRKGAFTGATRDPARATPERPRRHHVARRDRRDAAWAAVEAAAGHRGEKSDSHRVRSGGGDRPPFHRHHQQGPEGRGRARYLPARSVLSAQRDARSGAAPARTGRGRAAPGPPPPRG